MADGDKFPYTYTKDVVTTRLHQEILDSSLSGRFSYIYANGDSLAIFMTASLTVGRDRPTLAGKT